VDYIPPTGGITVNDELGSIWQEASIFNVLSQNVPDGTDGKYEESLLKTDRPTE
jgi:hypothetical protein